MSKLWALPLFLVLTGCSSAVTEYSLGNDYELRQAAIVPQLDALYASQLIPSTVIEIAWDNSYILAKQLLEEANPNSPDAQMGISKQENYWIIDVKHNQRFGPYTEKQFEAQKEEFNITKSLELQDVSIYMTKS